MTRSGSCRRRTGRRVGIGVAAVALAVGGCTTDGSADREAADEAASATDRSAAPSDPDGEVASDDDEPEAAALAEVPSSTAGWASSLGLPVVGAVRTSTPLARLEGVDPDERLAVCQQVAAELDGIATPEVLTAIAVSADPETATLLVGDLRAKADLLAVCDRDGDEVDALVAEVAATHEVAVAWLAAIEDAS